MLIKHYTAAEAAKMQDKYRDDARRYKELADDTSRDDLDRADDLSAWHQCVSASREVYLTRSEGLYSSARWIVNDEANDVTGNSNPTDTGTDTACDEAQGTTPQSTPTLGADVYENPLSHRPLQLLGIYAQIEDEHDDGDCAKQGHYYLPAPGAEAICLGHSYKMNLSDAEIIDTLKQKEIL